MSGGAWDYVMGYNTNASSVGGNSEITSLYSDFFTNSEWNKYYDKYVNASTSTVTYNQRILGDATGEMGPFNNNRSSWYRDYAYFVHTSSPYFSRGGYYGTALIAGVFYFTAATGGNSKGYSFRVVLAPNSMNS